MDIKYKEGIRICKENTLSVLSVHSSIPSNAHLFISLKYKQLSKPTSLNIALTMKDPQEDPTLEEVDFMEQSLHHKLMEEPTKHVPIYHMERFSTSGGIKRKRDYYLKDQTPSKKLCEYNYLYHKQLTAELAMTLFVYFIFTSTQYGQRRSTIN